MTALLPVAAIAHIKGPAIDWSALSPIVVLTLGALLVLLVGLLASPIARERIVPALSAITLLVAIAFEVSRFHHQTTIISGALRVDDLALILDLVFAIAGLATVALSAREPAASKAGHGEYHSLMLFSILGMAVLVSAQNLITLFIAFELLSIPLYILCAADVRRSASLESGLKYLVIGSVGSATLVYGLALIYGATGSTDFTAIAAAITGGPAQPGGLANDPLLLSGIGLVIVAFAFKASVAPFHQWTPDVYEGAPTPITAFMATATKAAALGVFLRFFDVAVIGAQETWAPLLATLATITIIVGNVGALGQSSMKRILAYSGVAQAGYMLAGVVVGTQLGVNATIFYILTYLPVNVAAFAVIVARQRERPGGEDISALRGLGSRQPWLAWPMTIAMLSLAGIPGTVGFIGKLYLIRALVAGNYTWLAVVIVVGSMISLGYYLRVVATMWMSGTEREPVPAHAATVAAGAGAGGRPAIAGGSPEADDADAGGWPAPDRAVANAEIAIVAAVFGAAGVVFGIIPSPLLRLVAHAGRSIAGIF
ncbi:MAG: NADH-quinone oxidoreductase subunit [Solirubrobacteraceae bacterium]|jgi:NADH-quinone oxidoreductase subunit N|nr:NADH-quinone oxidoreductase subunit [Solirubrobacteraceae bacterium]